MCGIKLPEGLTEASRLEEPIFTPAAKAELGEHDESITFEQTVERIGEELAVAIRDLSIALYRAARDIAAGNILDRADLTTARCGSGLPPTALWGLVGQRTGRAYVAGDIVEA